MECQASGGLAPTDAEQKSSKRWKFLRRPGLDSEAFVSRLISFSFCIGCLMMLVLRWTALWKMKLRLRAFSWFATWGQKLRHQHTLAQMPFYGPSSFDIFSVFGIRPRPFPIFSMSCRPQEGWNRGGMWRLWRWCVGDLTPQKIMANILQKNNP